MNRGLKMWRVLCIDDDPSKVDEVAEFFTTWTKDNPYGAFDVTTQTDFEQGSRMLTNERFDLVTLDLHGETDPLPSDQEAGDPTQQGKQVLDRLRTTRFVPVIFFSGFADKISELQSPIVQVVKKGENDAVQIREAAKTIFGTGLPTLLRHIDEEQRSYLWDTVDKHWSQLVSGEGGEELPYLLARRLATRLNRDSVKNLLKHDHAQARPIEFYIYPPVAENIKTGGIYGPDENGLFWIVATPACDFAQGKAERVLLIGATNLSDHTRFADWSKKKWIPRGEDKGSNSERNHYNKLCDLLRNSAGDRYYFLPGTFFLPDLVADMQRLQQVETHDLDSMKHICSLDSSYREEFILRLSKYYGRIGTPDLEIPAVIERLAEQ